MVHGPRIFKMRVHRSPFEPQQLLVTALCSRTLRYVSGNRDGTHDWKINSQSRFSIVGCRLLRSQTFQRVTGNRFHDSGKLRDKHPLGWDSNDKI